MSVRYNTNYKGLNAITFPDGEVRYLSDDEDNELFEQMQARR